jgi:hypothetical protein
MWQWKRPRGQKRRKSARVLLRRGKRLREILAGCLRGHQDLLISELRRWGAVDIEPGMSPGEKAFRPFGAQQLLVDKKPKNLAAENLSQPRVIDPGNLMEEARLVYSALGHQEMKVGVKI